MFTSFKELEAYVLGCGMKKRIALANAHDEPALSAVVNPPQGRCRGYAGR